MSPHPKIFQSFSPKGRDSLHNHHSFKKITQQTFQRSSVLFLHFSIQLPIVTQNLTHPLHVGNFLLHLPRIAIGERTSLQEGSWCKLLNYWHMGRCFLEPKTLPLSPSDQLENRVVLTQHQGSYWSLAVSGLCCRSLGL